MDIQTDINLSEHLAFKLGTKRKVPTKIFHLKSVINKEKMKKKEKKFGAGPCPDHLAILLLPSYYFYSLMMSPPSQGLPLSLGHPPSLLLIPLTHSSPTPKTPHTHPSVPHGPQPHRITI